MSSSPPASDPAGIVASPGPPPAALEASPPSGASLGPQGNVSSSQEADAWVSLAVSHSEEPEFIELNLRRIPSQQAKRFQRERGEDEDGQLHVWRLPRHAHVGQMRKWLPVCPATERTDLIRTGFCSHRYAAALAAGSLWDPGNKFFVREGNCWYVPTGFDLARSIPFLEPPELQERVAAAAAVAKKLCIASISADLQAETAARTEPAAAEAAAQTKPAAAEVATQTEPTAAVVCPEAPPSAAGFLGGAMQESGILFTPLRKRPASPAPDATPDATQLDVGGVGNSDLTPGKRQRRVSLDGE